MTDQMTVPNDFTGHDDFRDKNGVSLAEAQDMIRNVHNALKADLFYHMACKRRAVDMDSFRYHEKRVAAISERLAEAKRRAKRRGVTLA